ncbi:MAG: winged helix-turn-helix domain-containing protein [Acidimicrobiia bacterium]
MPVKLTLDQARRIALAAQGFCDGRPTGKVDVRHLRRVLDRVGLLQIDSVNVLARAHYLPLFSRLGPYPMGSIDHLAYRRGELFEYWAHAASLLPVGHRPLLGYRMAATKPWRAVRKIIEDQPEYLEAVLEEVGRRGPVAAGELDDDGPAPGAWWDWGKAKLALEWLFTAGRLAVADRVNFVRRYDLPERVFPPEVLERPMLGPDEARRELLRLAARAHGVGTAADLADYYRIRLSDARPHLEAMAEAGELGRVEVEGWRHPAYLHPEARLPRRVEGRALLAPFDPLIWFRDRTERMFGFHYRIEIYVPASKRVYGYYVLPFLLGGELAARVDLKADRAAGKLLVRGSYRQDGHDPDRVAGELAGELRSMAGWLGLGEVALDRRGDLAGMLRRAVG